MKQAKIKKFLNLIGSLHHSTRPERSEPPQHQSPPCEANQPQHYNTISLDKPNGKDSNELFQRDFLEKPSDSNHKNIFFNEKTIKRRYEDKKNFYEAYRETLQKRKESMSTSNQKTTERILREEQERSHCKQLQFPINRSKKRGERRESFTYQKILRKKSILLTNRSVSIVPYDSEKRLRMERLKRIEESIKQDQGKISGEEESMREKRLNYKPIFRIKKLNLQSCRTQTALQSEQLPKLQKSALSKKCLKVKTQPTSNEQRYISFREAIQKKKKQKLGLHLNDKFSAWDHDKTSQLQQTSRLFF